MDSIPKNKYLHIYRSAHKNAIDLLGESKLLFKNKHYARSYALAYTSLEEISKSQLAADVSTGFSDEKEFLKRYTDHKSKINRMKWAHIDASSFPHNDIWVGPDIHDTKTIDPKEPSWIKRQEALYVDLDEEGVIKIPNDSISESEAESIIHVVETALHRIWEVTEYWGHQIGTKGFMK